MFQISKRMEVAELKALLVEYIKKEVDDGLLPTNFDESKIKVMLLKPDADLETFKDALKKEYRTMYSYVDKIKVPVEQLRSSGDLLSAYNIQLEGSVFVVEIKSHLDFKCQGEDEELEEEDTYSYFRSPAPKPLPFPEKSLASQNGLVGLRNIGNTCYMNSGLQCLSNCLDLTQYFLRKKFRSDLNKDNPLGSGGKLVEAYASLLFEMWHGVKTVVSPSNFKQAVAKFKDTVAARDAVRQLQPTRQPRARQPDARRSARGPEPDQEEALHRDHRVAPARH